MTERTVEEKRTKLEIKIWSTEIKNKICHILTMEKGKKVLETWGMKTGMSNV